MGGLSTTDFSLVTQMERSLDYRVMGRLSQTGINEERPASKRQQHEHQPQQTVHYYLLKPMHPELVS